MSEQQQNFDTTGMRIWKNLKNRWTVLELHYSADPAKRSSEWIDSIRSTMSKSQWDREYELQWRTYSGFRVFEDFSRKMHVNANNQDPFPGLPLLLGFDFGLTPACVISQLTGPRLTVLDELVAFNEPISEFAPSVMDRLRTRFPGMEHLTFVDPAGFDRSQVDARRCVDELIGHGFSPQPGLQGTVERKESVVRLLNTMYKGEPCLKINPRCDWLIGGMEGGYRYHEDIARRDKIVKNEHSHVADAMCYITTRIGDLRSSALQDVVTRPPRYGFQRKR